MAYNLSINGNIYSLAKSRVMLGSASSCDVCIDEWAPLQALIEDLGQNKYKIISLDSSKLIVVSGKVVLEAELSIGDDFKLGDTKVSLLAWTSQQKPSSETFGFLPLVDETPTRTLFLLDLKNKSKALQVTYVLGANIYNIFHFKSSETIHGGPLKKNDLPLSEPFFLTPVNQGNYEVQIPRGFSVSLQSSVGRISFLPGQKNSIEFCSKDILTLENKNLRLLFQFVEGIPELRNQRFFTKDPLFRKIWMTSLLVALAIMILLSKVHVSTGPSLEDLAEHLVLLQVPHIQLPEIPKINFNRITNPEKNIQQPSEAKGTTSIVQKQLIAADQGGRGQLKSGAKGQRGTPKNKIAHTVPQEKAMRPGHHTLNPLIRGQDGTRGNGRKNIIVHGQNNQGLISQLLASGKTLSQSADVLTGQSIQTTAGSKGQNLQGAHIGGGGPDRPSQGLGGLSTQGLGAGEKGQGLGLRGQGTKLIGSGGSALYDSLTHGNIRVEGGIDPREITRLIEKNKDSIKYCYEREANIGNPNLAGRVNLKWTINAQGHVEYIQIVSTTLQNSSVENCVMSVVKKIQFPSIRGGGIAEVIYPFVFRPANR